jgi:hypothetical protein
MNDPKKGSKPQLKLRKIEREKNLLNVTPSGFVKHSIQCYFKHRIYMILKIGINDQLDYCFLKIEGICPFKFFATLPLKFRHLLYCSTLSVFFVHP